MSTVINTERNRKVPLNDPEVVVENEGVFMDAVINGVPEQTQGQIFTRFRRGFAKRMNVGGCSSQVAMAEMREILASWSPLDQPAVFDVVKMAIQCMASPQPDNSDLVLSSLLLGKPPMVVRGGQQ